MATSTSKAKTPLRFAALIRVSTEGQERKNESLAVQRQQIERAIETLGGRIIGWYGGQEHGTAGYEKKEIDRLLSDARKGRFDSFICDKNDRWSRDNTKSAEGLDVFAEHNIRFFVQTTEYNLHVPEHRLFVEMNVVFASFQARSQKQRSLASRIKKAKRGCSACGKRPWGRMWDKTTETWSVDTEKRAIIEDVARRYLAGESLAKLAEEYNQNTSNLHKVLTQRCGDTWTQTFRHEDGRVDVVETKVPRLLPEKTIRAIKRQLEANKTYLHGQIKNAYLLSRMIFCKHCGYTIFGQTNDLEQKRRYYRHCHTSLLRKCKHPKSWVPADEIEELVLMHLFNLFGNPVAVQKAIEAASPDLDKIKQYEQRLSRITAELERIERGRQRILELVVRDAIRQEQAEAKLTDIKEREASLRDEQARLGDYLASRPSQEQITLASEKAVASISNGKPFSQMTWEEKRGLVQAVFSGKTPDGKRMGVYIEWNGKDWTFDIRGHVFEWQGYHRLKEKMRARMRDILDEDGPVSMRGQKALLATVTKSACGCTAASPRGCRSREGTARPAA